MKLEGVKPILPTPFHPDGTLDIPSLRRLIEYQKLAKVHGVAILGFMGEAHKLTEAERNLVVETVVEQAAGAFDIWVGVRALGTMGAVEQAQSAERLGADGVFVAPLSVQNDDVLYAHFQTVSASVEIPVMIHDFPASFAVNLTPALIAKLAHDNICPAIKLEDPPVGPKLSAIKALAPEMVVFGGLGGLYFLEELERGAAGIMTGFAFPEKLVEIYSLFTAGDHEAATRVFDQYAPLIRLEFQPKIGLAYRKHIYHQRGVFDTTFVRPPDPSIDAYTARELERAIERAGLKLSGVWEAH